MSDGCPNCGYHAERDELIRINDWVLSRTYTIHKGEKLQITKAESHVLFCIAKSGDQYISNAEILAQVSNKKNPKQINVMFYHMRKKMGGSLPIERKKDAGVRWERSE